MKIAAAYLLAVLGGNATPSAADIKAILNSVGAEAENEMIDLLLSEAKGKDITELIAAGREKLASVPSARRCCCCARHRRRRSCKRRPLEAKKVEKEEIVEEEDEDMCFSLFD
ncbi:uncharacterized protein A4U43_C01F35960 [Asparagus officinalis]|uniref:60S acidic ribosomal protein P2 n=1 Tax=Asparagus officinalis TaxID=4686 RepID=A0A5P1FUR2_ASPOF|nr:uncharacterized protein A4U43_C01F35960 [Asparagus officinalis]